MCSISKNKNKLVEKLSKDDKKLFNDMVNASDEISACTSVENFKIGFIQTMKKRSRT